MTGAFVRLEPGTLRDLHWHPNENEWQYIINGTIQFGVFNGTGQVSEGSGGPGDVGYAPKGSGHYFINSGAFEADLQHGAAEAQTGAGPHGAPATKEDALVQPGQWQPT